MVTREEVIDVLKTIYDPELFIDIWTLGLIYDVEVKDDAAVSIRMTFTSLGCPAGPELIEQVKTRTEELPGVTETNIEVVFDPPWEPSEELKAMMGIL